MNFLENQGHTDFSEVHVAFDFKRETLLGSRPDLLQKGIEQEQEEWIRLKQGLVP